MRTTPMLPNEQYTSELYAAVLQQRQERYAGTCLMILAERLDMVIGIPGALSQPSICSSST